MTFQAGRFVLVQNKDEYITSFDTWAEAKCVFPIEKGCRLEDGETGRIWDHYSKYEWEAAAT